MKEIYELVMSKNGKVVAIQPITGWTVNEVENLWLDQEREGRTCEIKKTFREDGEEVTP